MSPCVMITCRCCG